VKETALKRFMPDLKQGYNAHTVIAGLDPAIHPLRKESWEE
jgi:hypothetical protein